MGRARGMDERKEGRKREMQKGDKVGRKGSRETWVGRWMNEERERGKKEGREIHRRKEG